MLNGYADEIVFCDPNPSLKDEFASLMAQRQECSPTARLLSNGARRGIQTLERINVLFYRRDGTGDGGSVCLCWLNHFYSSCLRKCRPKAV